MGTMADESDHSARVDVWMERATKGLPPEQLVVVFQRGFAAMWRRAHTTLGDVTLTAIVDRVLYSAAEQFSALSALTVDATGLQCTALRERSESLQDEHLEDGLRFILVEFLTVLGNLTDEILTPALHSELSKIEREEKGRSDEGMEP